MTRILIAPYDFNPRTPDELRFSQGDYILVSELGHGWCWGQNLSQGGAEGKFPKRYSSVPRTYESSLNRALLETASVCCRMDMLIAKSSHLPSEDDRRSLQKREETLNSRGALSYLSSGCAGGIWEKCVRSFVGAFEEKRVDPNDFVLCRTKLRGFAERLDQFVGDLVTEIRKHAKVMPSVLENALCMQTTLRSLLEVTNFAFDAWNGKFPSSPSTPYSRTSTALTGTTLSPSPSFPPPSCSPTQHRSLLHALLLSYPTLRNLTFLVSLASCCLQFRAYVVASHLPGSPSDPDFYTAVQSLLMQLLTTYTGLAPTAAAARLAVPVVDSEVALPDGGTDEDTASTKKRSAGRTVSALWVALLCAAAVVLNFTSVAVYVRDAAASPLLGFFGSVVQAITVLQLAARVGDRFNE
ncbi:hypothetical protein NKR23_g7380 [Pleurostoma richardsiae]|uniref:SH3 domain-containing protein n=1 Tax=Pleurostoma richardsiae TaxID=41990 RepID=A0AA38RMX6_9PEZI|nr:hypothetical protein NKR23_g7380 [Pleurostoma richardsiae]